MDYDISVADMATKYGRPKSTIFRHLGIKPEKLRPAKNAPQYITAADAALYAEADARVERVFHGHW